MIDTPGFGAVHSTRRHITQEMILRYADASGDRNPLHVDPDFAATTSFGGPIAHGFLTLALLSQWVSEWAGEAWLTSGHLDIAFIGAVRPGDVVTISGEAVAGAESGRTAYDVRCAVDSRDVLVGRVSVDTPTPHTATG